MSTERPQILPVVMFCHQGQYFALEATYVRSQWSARAGDQTKTSVSFASFLDLTPTESYPATVQHLELAGPDGHWWLGLEQAADLVELSVTDIHPLPPLLSARRQFLALQALACYQGKIVSLLDARVLQRLVNSRTLPNNNQ